MTYQQFAAHLEDIIRGITSDEDDIDYAVTHILDIALDLADTNGEDTRFGLDEAERLDLTEEAYDEGYADGFASPLPWGR